MFFFVKRKIKNDPKKFKIKMRKCEFVFVLRPNFIKTLISFLVSKLKNKKIKTAKELTTSRTFIFFFFLGICQ